MYVFSNEKLNIYGNSITIKASVAFSALYMNLLLMREGKGIQ